jgi:nucleoid DNA-binding protein
MIAALKDGQKVVITGFGSFNLKVTETKKGRNPKTGDIVMIPPKKKIRFKQSKEIF